MGHGSKTPRLSPGVAVERVLRSTTTLLALVYLVFHALGPVRGTCTATLVSIPATARRTCAASPSLLGIRLPLPLPGG